MQLLNNLLVLVGMLFLSTPLQAQAPAPEKLSITHLTGDLYVYTTYNVFDKNYFPQTVCTW